MKKCISLVVAMGKVYTGMGLYAIRDELKIMTSEDKETLSAMLGEELGCYVIVGKS